MKSTGRSIVFFAGFAFAVLVANLPNSAMAFQEEEGDDHSLDAPWGEINDVVLKVGGVEVAKNESNNQVLFSQPKNISLSATCDYGVGANYAEDVGFYMEWKLTGGTVGNTGTSMHGHSPTLSPGESDSEAGVEAKDNANGIWNGTVEIRAATPQAILLAEYLVVFIGS